MAYPLRVLVVDDSEADAVVLAAELQRGGYEPSFERVESPAALKAALEVDDWDLILSNYSMPQFNGTSALTLYQQKGVDIPFIVVSGKVGEYAAVEMMKTGAHDYVMKHDLTRLAPAVDRELRAARERKARRQAEAAMAHLASVVESCDDAIISKSLDGVVLSWNAGAERIYGYTAAEMVGRSVSVLLPSSRPDEVPELLKHIECGQHVDRFETVRIRKDGQPIDVSLTLSPVKDAAGRITGASIVARDITQRKQQEAERFWLIQELTGALARVKTLSGLLPICSSCKKIRNDQGYWEQVESYVKNHSDADFTHSLCPDCAARLHPDLKLSRSA